MFSVPVILVPDDDSQILFHDDTPWMPPVMSSEPDNSAMPHDEHTEVVFTQMAFGSHVFQVPVSKTTDTCITQHVHPSNFDDALQVGFEAPVSPALVVPDKTFASIVAQYPVSDNSDDNHGVFHPLVVSQLCFRDPLTKSTARQVNNTIEQRPLMTNSKAMQPRKPVNSSAGVVLSNTFTHLESQDHDLSITDVIAQDLQARQQRIFKEHFEDNYSEPLVRVKRRRIQTHVEVTKSNVQLQAQCFHSDRTVTDVQLAAITCQNSYCRFRQFCTCSQVASVSIPDIQASEIDPYAESFKTPFPDFQQDAQSSVDDAFEYSEKQTTLFNVLDWFDSRQQCDTDEDSVDERWLTFFVHQSIPQIVEEHPCVPEANVKQINDFVQLHMKPILDIHDLQLLHTHWRLRPLQLCMRDLFSNLQARKYTRAMMLQTLLRFRGLHSQSDNDLRFQVRATGSQPDLQPQIPSESHASLSISSHDMRLSQATKYKHVHPSHENDEIISPTIPFYPQLHTQIEQTANITGKCIAAHALCEQCTDEIVELDSPLVCPICKLSVSQVCLDHKWCISCCPHTVHITDSESESHERWVNRVLGHGKKEFLQNQDQEIEQSASEQHIIDDLDGTDESYATLPQSTTLALASNDSNSLRHRPNVHLSHSTLTDADIENIVLSNIPQMLPFVTQPTLNNIREYMINIFAPMSVFEHSSTCIINGSSQVHTWFPRNIPVIVPHQFRTFYGLFTVFGAKLQYIHQQLHLIPNDQHLVIFQQTNLHMMNPFEQLRIADLCAGAGTLSHAFTAFAHKIVYASEHNPIIAQVLEQNCSATIDVADTRLKDTIANCVLSQPDIIVSGFPCQPWSRQGSTQGIADERGNVVLAVLYQFVTSGSCYCVLECVDTFLQHEHAKHMISVLESFQTFSFTSTILDFSKFWCSNRKRWLCIVSTQHSAKPTFMPIQPVGIKQISHCHQHFTDDELHDFLLTEQEIELYTSTQAGPILDRIIQDDDILPTVLHRYGSVATACPCQCSSTKLANLTKGIRGKLKEVFINDALVLRFLTPSELRAYSCISQSIFFGTGRLALALIGQAAPSAFGLFAASTIERLVNPMQTPQEMPSLAAKLTAPLALPLHPKAKINVRFTVQTQQTVTHNICCSASFTVKAFALRFLPDVCKPYFVPLNDLTHEVILWNDPVYKHATHLLFKFSEELHHSYFSTKKLYLDQLVANKLFNDEPLDNTINITVVLPWNAKSIEMIVPNTITALQLRNSISSIIGRTCSLRVDGQHVSDDVALAACSLSQVIRVKPTGLLGAGKWGNWGNDYHHDSGSANTQIDPLQQYDAWAQSSSSAGPSWKTPSNENAKATAINPYKLLKELMANHIHQKFLQTHVSFILRKLGKANVLYAFEQTDAFKALKDLAYKQSLDLVPDKFAIQVDTLQEPALTLNIQDYTLPSSTWIEDIGKKLVPILDVAQIRALASKDATGIALASVEQAQAFLTGCELSTSALALVIPCDDKPLQTSRFHVKQSVALMHKKTEQQIVFECFIVQLGKIVISRQVQQHALPIPAPSSRVVFILHHNEQEDWEQRCKFSIKFLLTDIPTLEGALLTIITRSVSRDKKTIRITALLKTVSLPDILRLSGDPYFIIPLDSEEKPHTDYRPIWLGPISRPEALRRASLDVRCLGIVSMRINSKGSKQTVYAVRALHSDVSELRPIVTLQKQGADYIPAYYKYEVQPIPEGFDAENVKNIFTPIQWKCRPLLTKPGFPNTWIVACAEKPKVSVLSFPQGDIILTELNNANARRNQPIRRNFHKQVPQADSVSLSSAQSAELSGFERKLDTFIKQQETVNLGLQRDFKGLQQQFEVVNQKTTQFEQGLAMLGSLKGWLESKFDSIEQRLPSSTVQADKDSALLSSPPRKVNKTA